MYMSKANTFSDAATIVVAADRQPKTRQTGEGRSLTKHEILFHEGDSVRQIFEVKSGVVRLTKVLEDGRRQVIAFGYPGDIVGFPSGGVYYAECDAIVPAEVIAHSIKDLESGTCNPKLHERLVTAALKEIGFMQEHFVMLGRKNAKEKTASFLSELMDRTGSEVGDHTRFHIPMSREDMADFLGLTLETVSRTLSKFRKAKMIMMEDTRSIIVLDHDALCDMAG